MNKTELMNAVSVKTGMNKKDVERAVNAALEVIAQEIQKEEKVQITGFGIFEAKNREARVGRNPRTKKPMQIPATRVPAFKASKTLKDFVAK